MFPKISLMLTLLVASVVYAAVPYNAALLNWGPVTKMSDDSPIPAGQTVTYNVYSYAKATPTVVTKVAGDLKVLTTTRTNLKPGEYCWYATAVVNKVESAPSPPGCKVIFAPVVSTTPDSPAVMQVD